MKLSPKRAKVLEFVTANPHATMRECADAIEMTVASVWQHVYLLRAVGLIPSRVPVRLGHARVRVLEYMNAHPEATAKECAAATGMSFGAVRQHQFRLRTAGLIPLAPAGAREAGNWRSTIVKHETQCARIRDELDAMELDQARLATLLDPAARRRGRARLRRLQEQLRHHESRRRALLESLVERGSEHVCEQTAPTC